MVVWFAMDAKWIAVMWLGLLALPAIGLGAGGDTEGKARFEQLSSQLEDADPGKRRRAVRDLALLGGRRAWEQVLRSLEDPKGEVADEAQFALGGLDEPRVQKQLFGRAGLKSKDPLVRRRVAESFGRMKHAVEGSDLLREIQRREPLKSEMLLWSVERLAQAGKLGGDLEKCARGLEKLAKGIGEGTVRAQAACALTVVDPDRAKACLGNWLGDRAPELRRAALLCAVQMEHDAVLSLGRRLLEDKVGGVRLAALQAVASAGVKESLVLLVVRLEAEPRYRLKVACVELLQQLSGRRTKMNPSVWRRWVESQPADWAGSATAASPAEVGGTSSFAGLPILSDRVCFLIDFSGSLWYEREGRPARKGKVDELVRASMPLLREGTKFNIMPYTGEPHPWREQLVDASARNVKQAIADFEANRVRGSGNVFDAVLLALSDANTDRLVILTDGAPTGGARWKLELMVPLLRQRVRFSGVAIDALVVDARPGLRKFWFQLAQQTGGRAVAIEL
jgi:HEAT repeat protein